MYHPQTWMKEKNNKKLPEFLIAFQLTFLIIYSLTSSTVIYGDKGSNINKICLFFVNNFYGYFGNTKESARIKLVGKNNDGDFFGNYLKSWVIEFQKRTGLESDGNIGPLTLKMLVKYGFKY